MSFTIASPEPPSAVRDRLVAAIMDPAAGTVGFRGEIWVEGFRLTRRVEWWEKQVPIIAEGTFTQIEGGTSILVETRPQPWVVLVGCAFSVAVLAMLVSSPRRTPVEPVEILVLLGFFAVGWGAMLVNFIGMEHECRRALERIVNPDPTAPGTTRPPGLRH